MPLFGTLGAIERIDLKGYSLRGIPQEVFPKKYSSKGVPQDFSQKCEPGTLLPLVRSAT